MPPRGALIIPAPEAEPHVSAVRALHDPVAILGVPAHLTVLFPFATPDEIDPEELRVLFDTFAVFDYDLVAVRTFAGGTVWLDPSPRRPFVALTDAVWRRWPRWPPYGGAHTEVIPHLTVSERPIGPSFTLPIRCQAREVVWLVEGVDLRWRPHARFALRQAATSTPPSQRA